MRGSLPTQQWGSRANKMRFWASFSTATLFFQKTLKSYPPVLNSLVACQDDHRRGTHHTTLLLFSVPLLHPNRQSRTEGSRAERGHSAARALSCPVLAEASGPEPRGRDSAQNTAPGPSLAVPPRSCSIGVGGEAQPKTAQPRLKCKPPGENGN